MNFETLCHDLKINKSAIEPFFTGKYNQEVFKNAAYKLAQDLSTYDNSRMAGRMLIYDIARLCTNINDYVKILRHRLSPKIAKYMLDNSKVLQAALDKNIFCDYKDHDIFSAATLINGYLLKPTYNEEPWETPSLKNMRISVQFYMDISIERVVQCFDELSNSYYSPASPTIFNAGTIKPQQSSCFLAEIDDTLKSILYTGLGDTGMISSLSGGLGIGISHLRHSQVGFEGMSSGVVPAARVYDRMILYVDQRGKRKGAATVFLDISHIDVWDYVNATNNFISHELRFSNLNTCLWMHDLFFKRLAINGKWTVFCPAKAKGLVGSYGYDFEQKYHYYELLAETRDKEYKKLKSELVTLKEKLTNDKSISNEYQDVLEKVIMAKKNRIEHITYNAIDLYRHIIDIQVKSGMPYIMHADTINYKSNQKNYGKINSSNLCLEICEVSTPEEIASCNLSSLNMSKFVKSEIIPSNDIQKDIRDNYDFQTLGIISGSVVENIDRVISTNYYPLDKFNDSNEVIEQGKISVLNNKMRPLGVGVSGFDDAIKQLDLVYESDHTKMFNRMF